MKLESDAKFEEKLTCSLENDMRNLANFTKALKSLKNLGLLWDPFDQST